MSNIETPPILAGNEAEQLRSMYRYLIRLADQLNSSLGGIGGNDFTDSERKILNGIIEKPAGDGQTDDMQTLKSWIIKTAEYTQSTIEKIRKNLVSESVAEGQFGRYVRRTELEAEVTPEGITQNYSFEELVQALQTYTVNAKNYIKSGLLRTVNNIPVYGIAVGKDIVTFEQDGEEVYHDGNKVAEFTADELSFWQNGSKVAGYTGSRISFYYGGTEVFYILNGKIYCQNDLVLASGKKLIIDTENFKINSAGKVTIKGDGEFSGNLQAAGGTFSGDLSAAGGTFKGNLQAAGGTFSGDLSAAGGSFSGNLSCTGKTVDIKSENFVIDSELKVMKTGNWGLRNLGLLGEGSKGYVGIGIIGVAETGLNKPKSSITMQDQDGDIGVFHMTREKANGMATGRLVFQTGKTSGGSKANGIWAYIMGEIDGQMAWVPAGGTLGEGNGGEWNIIADIVNYKTLVQSSSRDVKHDIADMQSPGERLDRLRPVTFVYNNDKEGRIRQGLILEEAREIMPEICTETGINYMELVPMLLKEVQELRKRVAALKG